MDDYKKVRHCIKYLHEMQSLELMLEGMNTLSVVQWHVDGLFAVHPNMRSHTGITMVLGKGAPIAQSTKQKIEHYKVD